MPSALAAALAALTMVAALADASEGCSRWQRGYHFPGLGVDSDISAIVEFDDGTGPALYVGGRFEAVDGIEVNNIAKWDGAGWSALSGPNGTGTQEGYFGVSALAIFDDGSGPALYAGGVFDSAGGVAVNHIAKWDGAEWSALTGPGGTGTDDTVVALAVHDDGSGPALYAGGWFDEAGGVAVNNVAKWDGAQWSALSGPTGTGTDHAVLALAVHDDGSGPALYAGGYFGTAGGVTANHVAKWDGADWSPLAGPGGTGTDDRVATLEVFDDGSGPALYAGGTFATAGGVTVNRVAKWNGTTWSALTGPGGTGMAGPAESVVSLAVFDNGSGPALYAGGSFDEAGGVAVNNVAMWDGAGWSALDGPNDAGTDGKVDVVAVFDDGFGPTLMTGGDFDKAGGVWVNGIARWDGIAWSALPMPPGAGIDDTVVALAVFDDGSGPALYAGGWFDNAGGGLEVNRIARWNGAAWSAIGGPEGNGYQAVQALAVFDDGSGEALYAGGYFETADGIPVNNIARWDGTAWSALNGPAGIGTENGRVLALAVLDDGSGPALYAGGTFDTAGGITVNYVARWDGTTWSALTAPGGTGVDSGVGALAVFDDGSGDRLFAGGGFTHAGGLRVNHIARWDGQDWSPLAGPFGTGMSVPRGGVSAFGVFDDGQGPALFAGGAFGTAGGLYSENVGVWRCLPDIFADGFETGTTLAWWETVPNP